MADGIFKDIVNRVAALPRAIQWAFWAAVLTLGFLIWDASIATIAATWASRADEVGRQVADVDQAIVLTSTMRQTVTAFGDVQSPRSKTAGTKALTDAVHEILASHNVKKDDFNRTKTSRMRAGSLPGVAGAGHRVEQIIGDLQFEAAPEEVMQVVSDLESSPWIDAITSLRLTKSEPRMIRVNLSLEAWVLARDRGRSRR
ncbi:MAG: hypothetical protein QGH76_09115 [Phycisphaerales bacterium]|jgi:hypothetical protein|nr:hypothetical protein [Phycisphaerales bacterium]